MNSIIELRERNTRYKKIVQYTDKLQLLLNYLLSQLWKQVPPASAQAEIDRWLTKKDKEALGAIMNGTMMIE